MMKRNRRAYLIITAFLIAFTAYSQEKLDLANSNLEKVSEDGNFFWWKNQAINGASASYFVIEDNLIDGSNKALKVEVQTLGEKPWFVSTQFNQKFKGKVGDEVTVKFFAKKEGDGNGKLKLVLQSDVPGSFQGKDFYLEDEWQEYTYTFIIEAKSNKNQIKFWYLTEDMTFFLDEVSVYLGN